MSAQAELKGNQVIVPAPTGPRLHNRFFVGNLGQGGNLALSLVEAAWCVAGDRLEVAIGTTRATVGDLLAAGARDGERTEVEYLVYSEMRDRGLIVRHEGERLAVWPRGVGMVGPAEYHVQPCSERQGVAMGDLAAMARDLTLAAVVDEDGAVTHYKVQEEAPLGQCPITNLAAGSGRLLADRVLVEDSAVAAAWSAAEFLGQRQGPSLVLSLTEAQALRVRGVLRLADDLAGIGPRLQPHFSKVFPIYQALRGAGVVAKSGFKFGTHLRGYRGDPNQGHAEWLIQCVGDELLGWSDLSRAIRLSHGVRKRFLLASIEGGAARYLVLSWFRP